MAIATSTDLLIHYAHTQSETDVDYVLRYRTTRVERAADALAADTSVHYLMTGIKAGRLTSASVLPEAALTAHDTNYATLSICPYTLATGVVAAAYDAFTTMITGGTGDWVAGVAEPFTIAPATDVFAVTQGIALTVAKAGAGVVVPRCTIEIEYSID